MTDTFDAFYVLFEKASRMKDTKTRFAVFDALQEARLLMTGIPKHHGVLGGVGTSGTMQRRTLYNAANTTDGV